MLYQDDDFTPEEQARINRGLSPYAHEMNARGNDCADDCPACTWNDARAVEMRERLGYPTPPVSPSDADRDLLAEAHIKWEGDDRNLSN